MVLRALTDGAFTGTANIAVPVGKLGGILISTDGTNAATVNIYNKGKDRIFSLVTVSPFFAVAPILCEKEITAIVSGTGAAVFLYEWMD